MVKKRTGAACAGALSAKRRTFAEEYIADLNATQAAIRAGYSPRSAKVTGARLLADANVSALVSGLLTKRSAKAEITAEKVLAEIARLAFTDLRKLYDEHGALKLPSEWPDEVAATVAGVEVTEEFAGRGENRESIGFTKKVKTWDKPRALEMLGKHLGLFVDRVEHSGPNGAPIPVALQVVFVHPAAEPTTK